MHRIARSPVADRGVFYQLVTNGRVLLSFLVILRRPGLPSSQKGGSFPALTPGCDCRSHADGTRVPGLPRRRARGRTQALRGCLRGGRSISPVGSCGIGILPMTHGLEGASQRGVLRWGPQARATKSQVLKHPLGPCGWGQNRLSTVGLCTREPASVKARRTQNPRRWVASSRPMALARSDARRSRHRHALLDATTPEVMRLRLLP
jgi:hypothetical protein